MTFTVRQHFMEWEVSGEFPVEHIVGPVRGYRAFEVIDDGTPEYRSYHLGSTLMFNPWGAGIEIAKCMRREKHAAPYLNCMCGLYAFHHPRDVFNSFGGCGLATGVIEAAGKIIMHELGFRAERARIIAVAPGHPGRFGSIQNNYPNAQVFRRKEQMLKAYPPEVQ